MRRPVVHRDVYPTKMIKTALIQARKRGLETLKGRSSEAQIAGKVLLDKMLTAALSEKAIDDPMKDVVISVVWQAYYNMSVEQLTNIFSTHQKIWETTGADTQMWDTRLKALIDAPGIAIMNIVAPGLGSLHSAPATCCSDLPRIMAQLSIVMHMRKVLGCKSLYSNMAPKTRMTLIAVQRMETCSLVLSKISPTQISTRSFLLHWTSRLWMTQISILSSMRIV
jgi:hypothetical protein